MHISPYVTCGYTQHPTLCRFAKMSNCISIVLVQKWFYLLLKNENIMHNSCSIVLVYSLRHKMYKILICVHH